MFVILNIYFAVSEKLKTAPPLPSPPPPPLPVDVVFVLEFSLHLHEVLHDHLIQINLTTYMYNVITITHPVTE